jgi:hypothetical protein
MRTKIVKERQPRWGIGSNLDNVTLYSTKLRNPTQDTGGNNDNSVRFRRISEKWVC